MCSQIDLYKLDVFYITPAGIYLILSQVFMRHQITLMSSYRTLL